MAVQTKSHRKTTTVGQYLLERLQERGVGHIFGLPGDYILQFDKLIENTPIKFINTTRENTAGFMADAYARRKGLGVACITYGVGINIANATAQAYVESSPLVIISGAASAKDFAKSQRLHHLFDKVVEGPRDTTQLEIFKKITVAQAVLDNPQTAAEEIDRVLGHCNCCKKPVYIELPGDMVDAPLHLPEEKKKREHPTSNAQALKEVTAEVEHILKHCSRPVIWVGHEIQRYGLADAVVQFAEKFHIPICTSLLGKSTVSEFHPLFLGLYQGKLSRDAIWEYVEGCDCIFVLGENLNDVNTGIFTAEFPQEHLITVSTESIKVNHHQFSDVFMTDFVRKLATIESNVRFRNDYPANIDRAAASFAPKKGKKITTARLFECLQAHLKREHIVVSDFGDCLFGSAELTVDQNAFISNAYFANLGFGVPAAVGAQIASPKNRVVGIVGDGAFQMTGMELSTAARFGADPVIIIINNGGYATERVLQEGRFNDIGNWKYAELPKIFGKGAGVHVATEDACDKALAKAFATRGEYCLIEVEVGKVDYSPALQRFCKVVCDRKKS